MIKISNKCGMLLAESLGLIILGILCLINPFATTMAFPVFLAGILALGGLIQLLRSFALRHNKKAFSISIFSSLLAILVGVLLFKYQTVSISMITCLMIAYLCFDGIARMFFSSHFHHTMSWQLVMLSGFFSLALGLILMMSLPTSSFYTIGLLLGVSMIVFGISMFIMSIEMKVCNFIEIENPPENS